MHNGQLHHHYLDEYDEVRKAARKKEFDEDSVKLDALSLDLAIRKTSYNLKARATQTECPHLAHLIRIF